MPLKKSSKPSKSKVKNVVPKVFQGVQYKSSLEAYCAKALVEAGLPLNYETWKVELHPKLESKVECWEPKTKKNAGFPSKVRTFAPVSQNLRRAVYTPDFVCLEQGWVIETKGLQTEGFRKAWRSFRQYLHENNMHYFRLFMPGNHQEIDQVISLIKQANGRI